MVVPTSSDTLIVDVDGVLLNWWASFNQWIIDNNFATTNILLPNADYAFEGAIKENFRSQRDDLIRVFNQTFHVSKLKPIPGAIKALKRFREEGWTIKAVTSFSGDFESQKLREKNLLDVYGPIFQEIYCVPLYESKEAFLYKQPFDSIYVEDLPGHLNTALVLGYDPQNLYLIPRAFNEGNTDFQRLSWPAITESVFGEY